MVRVHIYGNGETTTKVYITEYSNGGQCWRFLIGRKHYEYHKPSYARARLDKLGYKFVDSYVHHSEEA